MNPGLVFAFIVAVSSMLVACGRSEQIDIAGSAQPTSSVRARQLGPRAEACAQCHPRQAAEWSQSVMGHAAVSPMFNALELLIEEQVARGEDCPDGAGILRHGASQGACFEPRRGHQLTGAGGPGWCVNCHAPAERLNPSLPPWSRFRAESRRPLRELLSPLAREGITCVACHQIRHPDRTAVRAGNPGWRSFLTGVEYPSRPEDQFGLFGIANSGYTFDPSELLGEGTAPVSERRAARSSPRKLSAHWRPSDATADYLRSSEMCGSCHDVRLFGADVLGAQRGERFKRLRNAYSEWRAWAQGEEAAGRRAATCQDCHMSTFPGVCVVSKGATSSDLCPPGMRFEPREPGERAVSVVATDSSRKRPVASHYFSSVDLPFVSPGTLHKEDTPGVDVFGTPLSARMRRQALLSRALRMSLAGASRASGRLRLPVVLQNVGAGHRVPAGFSQEREIWVHLRVEDATGRLIYEVGRTDRDDEDLHDKVFVRINTDPGGVDDKGRPRGLFGADVLDGVDVPRWRREGAKDNWVGRGLINLQNGFLRCVRCREDPVDGRCVGLPGEFRAARFSDGDYDLDTGRCRSNMPPDAALFEVFFPVGSLDSQRGEFKGPDAIIDSRSLGPGEARRYTYDLPIVGAVAPLTVRARLLFRSLPPFLVRAFAEYEAAQAKRGRRLNGPLVTPAMLLQLERVELAEQTLVVR